MVEKKLLSFTLCIAMVVCILSGCGSNSSTNSTVLDNIIPGVTEGKDANFYCHDNNISLGGNLHIEEFGGELHYFDYGSGYREYREAYLEGEEPEIDEKVYELHAKYLFKDEKSFNKGYKAIVKYAESYNKKYKDTAKMEVSVENDDSNYYMGSYHQYLEVDVFSQKYLDEQQAEEDKEQQYKDIVANAKYYDADMTPIDGDNGYFCAYYFTEDGEPCIGELTKGLYRFFLSHDLVTMYRTDNGAKMYTGNQLNEDEAREMYGLLKNAKDKDAESVEAELCYRYVVGLHFGRDLTDYYELKETTETVDTAEAKEYDYPDISYCYECMELNYDGMRDFITNKLSQRGYDPNNMQCRFLWSDPEAGAFRIIIANNEGNVDILNVSWQDVDCIFYWDDEWELYMNEVTYSTSDCWWSSLDEAYRGYLNDDKMEVPYVSDVYYLIKEDFSNKLAEMGYDCNHMKCTYVSNNADRIYSVVYINKDGGVSALSYNYIDGSLYTDDDKWAGIFQSKYFEYKEKSMDEAFYEHLARYW